MSETKPISPKWTSRVVILSLLLFLFTIPHILEDFATGEPGKAGVPIFLLATVVSIIIFLQALGLYWLGQGRRRGLFVQAGIGLFWPLAAGLAQLPVILNGTPYRSGAISVIYVLGILVVGILLFISAIIALRKR